MSDGNGEPATIVDYHALGYLTNQCSFTFRQSPAQSTIAEMPWIDRTQPATMASFTEASISYAT